MELATSWCPERPTWMFGFLDAIAKTAPFSYPHHFSLPSSFPPQQGPPRMASSDLKGKSLVIIGGTTGLGLSPARAFLEQGARLVVTGRNPANVRKAQKEFGNSARCFSADAIRPISTVHAIGMAF